MVYSVTSERAYREVIDESLITIGMEEPFNRLLVSILSQCCTQFDYEIDVLFI